MNKDWCFEPLKKYGGYIQTEEEYKEVMKIVEENLYKNKEKVELITIHKELLEEKNKEIERLKNIIDELEKYINEEYTYDEVGMKIFDASTLQDKIRELKEGKYE